MHRNENQNIDFKEQWRDESLKTVCAFANTDGGTIYVGINDKGMNVALKDIKKLLEYIPNRKGGIKARCHPSFWQEPQKVFYLGIYSGGPLRIRKRGY